MIYYSLNCVGDLKCLITLL
uniref:Uncharacterized protein n=1 Tax=Heterorhabditis bacteriophora TaxID=37862 RepID=A0A1I7W8G9_HETBA